MPFDDYPDNTVMRVGLFGLVARMTYAIHMQDSLTQDVVSMIRTVLFLLAPALALAFRRRLMVMNHPPPSPHQMAARRSPSADQHGLGVVIPPPRSGSAIVQSGIPKQKSDIKLRQTRRQAAGTDSMASPLPNQGVSTIPLSPIAAQ